MNYEDAIKEMEEIVEKLESENLPLKKAQELFERASVLAKFCQEELSKTTGKLYQIKKEFDQIVEEEV
ncbi:MAG: exodeoxyribonuclease VII small subunit [Clostridia bacterium]|nr:exodeoxyribonuclease VII small subunit [Clostridia bacterium]